MSLPKFTTRKEYNLSSLIKNSRVQRHFCIVVFFSA